MVNLTKMVSLAKIYRGFNKYSSWDAKSGRLESDENGEQGENDELGDNSPKMQ